MDSILKEKEPFKIVLTLEDSYAKMGISIIVVIYYCTNQMDRAI